MRNTPHFHASWPRNRVVPARRAPRVRAHPPNIMSTTVAEELDAFPDLACGGNGVLTEVASQLSVGDVARLLSVSKAWQGILDNTPFIWRALCQHAWEDKAYVPASLRSMSEGDFPSKDAAQSSDEKERQTLMALKIRELKDMMRSLRIQVGAGDLIEKNDFADAIMKARRKAAESHTATQMLLSRPWLLVRANEALPKAALRLSLSDSHRLRITEEELISFVFNLRLRFDGPLSAAVHLDPWWQGKGRGEARFSADGHVRFMWPSDPDDLAAEPMDPFAAMGMRNTSLGWKLHMDGRVVQLLFDGHSGPQELVCRHPVTWGWVLYSSGSCWTSWTMPACTEVDGEKMSSDPLLREAALCKLPSETKLRTG